MKKFILIIVLFTTTYSFSQCQKGDCKNGFSTMKYTDASYEGYYTDGKLDSIGLMFYNDKRVYLGEFNDNKYEGVGYYKWKNGATYFGNWKNGLQSGLGIEKNSAGNIQNAGLWVNGKLPKPLTSTPHKNNPKNCTGNCVDGIGKLMSKDSTYVLGIFENKKIVLGYINNKDFVYDGEIKNNTPNGYGQIKYLDTKDHFMGYFKNGKKHGTGIYTNSQNKRVFGAWINDEYQDPTKFRYDEKDYCEDLIALAKLTRQQRKALEKKKENLLDVVLKKQFLKTFEIRYKEALSLNEQDKITIKFPSAKDLPRIDYYSNLNSCKECKKIKSTDVTYKFTYDDVKIEVTSYQIKITYPKADPCISGNCKNGKGKKQYTTSVYEGQFKDGKAHGKGKEVWDNGNTYEGNYVNDLKEGKGIYTWSSGNTYNGEYKNNLREGKGIFTWKESGDRYEGEYLAGERHGKGTYIWKSNGNSYTGDWKNNERTGQGVFNWANGGKYVGEFNNNKFSGSGKEYNKDGKPIYEGNWKENEFDGKGTRYYNDGKYEGTFKEGKRNGFGTFYNDNGNKYVGNYKNDKSNGKGTYTWKNGDKYIGNYLDGRSNGNGKIIWSDGYYLIGTFKDGKAHGQVKEYYKDGKLAFEGEYKNGNSDGYGKEYDRNGKIIYEGQFKKGKKVE